MPHKTETVITIIIINISIYLIFINAFHKDLTDEK